MPQNDDWRNLRMDENPMDRSFEEECFPSSAAVRGPGLSRIERDHDVGFSHTMKEQRRGRSGLTGHDPLVDTEGRSLHELQREEPINRP